MGVGECLELIANTVQDHISGLWGHITGNSPHGHKPHRSFLCKQWVVFWMILIRSLGVRGRSVRVPTPSCSNDPDERGAPAAASVAAAAPVHVEATRSCGLAAPPAELCSALLRTIIVKRPMQNSPEVIDESSSLSDVALGRDEVSQKDCDPQGHARHGERTLCGEVFGREVFMQQAGSDENYACGEYCTATLQN